MASGSASNNVFLPDPSAASSSGSALTIQRGEGGTVADAVAAGRGGTHAAAFAPHVVMEPLVSSIGSLTACKYLTITAMPVYKEKSTEELRWEDHMIKRHLQAVAAVAPDAPCHRAGYSPGLGNSAFTAEVADERLMEPDEPRPGLRVQFKDGSPDPNVSMNNNVHQRPWGTIQSGSGDSLMVGPTSVHG